MWSIRKNVYHVIASRKMKYVKIMFKNMHGFDTAFNKFKKR